MSHTRKHVLPFFVNQHQLPFDIKINITYRIFIDYGFVAGTRYIDSVNCSYDLSLAIDSGEKGYAASVNEVNYPSIKALCKAVASLVRDLKKNHNEQNAYVRSLNFQVDSQTTRHLQRAELSKQTNIAKREENLTIDAAFKVLAAELNNLIAQDVTLPISSRHYFDDNLKRSSEHSQRHRCAIQ